MKAGYRFARGILRFVFLVVLGVRYEGAERIPRTGGLILASNHRTNMDPPLVGCGIDRELSFFAKAELFKIPIFGGLIRGYNAFPVRRGRADRQSLEIAVARVREGSGLVMFPEGTRSRTAEFLPPKLGVGLLARRTGVPVYPVFVGSGGAKVVWRSILRIDRIRIVYGEPVPASALAGANGDREIASAVMARIAELRDRVAAEQSS